MRRFNHVIWLKGQSQAEIIKNRWFQSHIHIWAQTEYYFVFILYIELETSRSIVIHPWAQDLHINYAGEMLSKHQHILWVRS